MNQFIGPECICWGSYMPAANAVTFVSHIHCTIKAVNTFKCYTYSLLTIFHYIASKKEFNIRKDSRGLFFWHPITSMLSLKIKTFKLFLWTSGMYFQMHTHRNTTNHRCSVEEKVVYLKLEIVISVRTLLKSECLSFKHFHLEFCCEIIFRLFQYPSTGKKSKKLNLHFYFKMSITFSSYKYWLQL